MEILRPPDPKAEKELVFSIFSIISTILYSIFYKNTFLYVNDESMSRNSIYVIRIEEVNPKMVDRCDRDALAPKKRRVRVLRSDWQSNGEERRWSNRPRSRPA